MAEYKIYRRPKDDIDDEETLLVEETANKIVENAYNGESFVEKLLKNLRKKGVINNKEFEWKLVHNANKKQSDEEGIYFVVPNIITNTDQ